MVRAVHKAKHREGAHEIRHAMRPGTAAIHWNAGDDSHPEDWLPGATPVRALCRPIPLPGAELIAPGCAQQGAVSHDPRKDGAKGRSHPVPAGTHPSVLEGVSGANPGVQPSFDFGTSCYNRAKVSFQMKLHCH